MRATEAALRVMGIAALLLLLTLPACGWRRMAVERHEQSQRIREQEIERRQLELDCLKRKQANPTIDCSQFQQPLSGTPAAPGTAPPPPAYPTPAAPPPAPPAQ
jgi:hypothetical protein